MSGYNFIVPNVELPPSPKELSMPTASPLHQLFQDHWDAWMRFDPLNATYVGDQRFNDLLPGATEESYQVWRGKLSGFRDRLAAVDRNTLPPVDQLNIELFEHLVVNEIAELGFNPQRLPISRCAGFHLTFPDIFQITPFENALDYENYISRLAAFKRYAQQNIELMRVGLQTGYLPPACTLDGIDQQLKAQMVTDPTASAFYQPFKQFPASLSDPVQTRLCQMAENAILTSVVEGYAALLEFLNQEYIPSSRESIASADLPGGDAFYSHRIYYYTSLHLTARQVHQTGLDEVRRIRAEM